MIDALGLYVRGGLESLIGSMLPFFVLVVLLDLES